MDEGVENLGDSMAKGESSSLGALSYDQREKELKQPSIAKFEAHDIFEMTLFNSGSLRDDLFTSLWRKLDFKLDLT